VLARTLLHNKHKSNPNLIDRKKRRNKAGRQQKTKKAKEKEEREREREKRGEVNTHGIIFHINISESLVAR
jgi:hypothetical protein